MAAYILYRWLQGLNANLVFTTFIVVFGSSFQFGYNIGVLNQVQQVSLFLVIKQPLAVCLKGWGLRVEIEKLPKMFGKFFLDARKQK